MLTPIELIKATVDGMIARKFGRIVNITSGAVKMPIPELGLSNGARTGLTGFVAGLSRQTVAHNVTINGLLPGPVRHRPAARQPRSSTRRSWARRRAELAKVRMPRPIPAKRFGTIEEFGAACAFLCSAHAGFITGQNLLHGRRRVSWNALRAFYPGPFRPYPSLRWQTACSLLPSGSRT